MLHLLLINVAVVVVAAAVIHINVSCYVGHVIEVMSTRIEQLFDFLYLRQGGMLEKSIMCALPLSFQRDMKRAHLSLLAAVPFFASLKTQNDTKYRRLMYLCVEKMVFCTFAPGHVVLYEGDHTCQLVLVKNGKLNLRSSSSSLS